MIGEAVELTISGEVVLATLQRHTLENEENSEGALE